MKKILIAVLIVIVAGALLIQLAPYGRDHTNPPVTQEAPWPSPEARELAVRACYDCHSNATVWPWYSNIAPVSWLVQHDVDEGRRRLNFSTWNQGRQEKEDMVRSVQNGSMPRWFYVPLHPSASLSASEKQQLIQALGAMGGEER